MAQAGAPPCACYTSRVVHPPRKELSNYANKEGDGKVDDEAHGNAHEHSVGAGLGRVQCDHGCNEDNHDDGQRSVDEDEDKALGPEAQLAQAWLQVAGDLVAAVGAREGGVGVGWQGGVELVTPGEFELRVAAAPLLEHHKGPHGAHEEAPVGHHKHVHIDRNKPKAESREGSGGGARYTSVGC